MTAAGLQWWFGAVYILVAFEHYYLDGLIWLFRRQHVRENHVAIPAAPAGCGAAVMPTVLLEGYNWLAALFWGAEAFIVKHVTSPAILQDFKLGLILAIAIVLGIAARKNWRVRHGSRSFRVDMLYFVFYHGRARRRGMYIPSRSMVRSR
jgi:hypothetical protein